MLATGGGGSGGASIGTGRTSACPGRVASFTRRGLSAALAAKIASSVATVRCGAMLSVRISSSVCIDATACSGSTSCKSRRSASVSDAGSTAVRITKFVPPGLCANGA